MSGLEIKLPAFPNQTEFNLRRWAEICADPFYAKLGHRIETDRHGLVVMTPPPQNPHSNRQSDIYFQLRTLMPEGHAQVVAPISTSHGIKGCDVTWASKARYEAIYDQRAHTAAPDICVEVFSPSNSLEEMMEKKALYFDAGAKAVWFCREDGTMEFYRGPERDAESASALCPQFPSQIEL